MIINKANLSSLFVAIKTAFNKGLKDTTPTWQRVATLVPSTTASTTYAWLGQFPRLREWLGDRQLKSLAAHAYSVVNKKFESSVAIPRDDIDDDTYGVFTPLFEEMGYAAATHPDELVYALLAAGFTTECYDGQNFFDTDHPVGNEDGGIVSVSNMQAGAESPWFLLDVNRPIKPLIFQRRRDYAIKAMTKDDDEAVFMRDEYRYGVDARVNAGFGLWQLAFGSKAVLNEANFKAARTSMKSLKSDEGRPLAVMPKLLVVGPSNESAAEALFMTRTLAGGGDNPLYKSVEVLVVPWLE
ncbi:Mu-like prophage major head subunit gpT family protein [Shewanella insulae]|uniref:Mu-like prophage major head subunit gpT family protein n=1 Tax=Shewanella insulae TaxID=2681496 RepID=UPI001EFE011A|nr:Mu-like prophage major head subunit gpT family protein [Shewanella insulae]MCG9755031.1 Mu-like prophage major head subunit gpT family protein [Shewanella insulae]